MPAGALGRWMDRRWIDREPRTIANREVDRLVTLVSDLTVVSQPKGASRVPLPRRAGRYLTRGRVHAPTTCYGPPYMADLRFEDVERLLESTFGFVTPDGLAVTLRLTEVRRLPATPGAPRAEPFALLFAGPRQPSLGQGTRRLEHERLGVLEIFLVPVGYGPDGGLLYEAIFN